MTIYLIEHKIGEIATVRAAFRDRPTEQDRTKAVEEFEQRAVFLLPEIVTKVRQGLLSSPVIELEIIEN